MIILGLNAYHGDASACLIRDGALIAACEEERFRRIKHCAGFPALAIASCLRQNQLPLDAVEVVAISRNPQANLFQKLVYAVRRGGPLAGLIKNRLSNTFKVAGLEQELIQHLKPVFPFHPKIFHVEHHLAHMASSFFVSPFEEAAVLSVDGFGDFTSTKWGIGKARMIRPTGQVLFPHSLGLFYTALTQYLGFPNYGDEYKVMALAAFGKPRFLNQCRGIIRPDENGFRLDLDYFVHHNRGVAMNWKDGYPVLEPCFSQKLVDSLGPVRQPDQPLTERHYDLAASLQTVFEEIYFHLLHLVYRETKSKNICLAGGCAMNSVANGKIRAQTPFERVFIQPVAGDAGTAVGAAFYAEHMLLKQPRRFQMDRTYWGPSFGADEVRRALQQEHVRYREMDEDAIINETASALRDGKIVGWFQNAMEFGARALGNRSLLADPRQTSMREILNERVKHRETFRPFAPAVLAEDFAAYFDASEPDYFMTRVYPVREEKRCLIPAVCHVDGTGRVQVVEQKTNPKFWRLIQAFKRLTGIPVLLNTSFNDNEPIVCTPAEALACFLKGGMDILVIDNFWVAEVNRTAQTRQEQMHVFLEK